MDAAGLGITKDMKSQKIKAIQENPTIQAHNSTAGQLNLLEVISGFLHEFQGRINILRHRTRNSREL